jgi:hypothetical protein
MEPLASGDRSSPRAVRSRRSLVATHTFIHFEDEEAAYLASLKSIHFDLWSTVRLCEYLQAQFKAEGNPLPEITDAFSTAILVRYSRAFVSGVRKALEEEVMNALDPEQHQQHERFRAFRDKHIAHSVNAFEDTKIQARYCAERLYKEGITSVSAARCRVFGLSSADVEQIIDLCNTFLAHVDAQIEYEQNRLLSVIRAIPLADLFARESSPPFVPDSSKIA